MQVLSKTTSSTTDRTSDPIDYLANVKHLRDKWFSGTWNYIVCPNHANATWATHSRFPLSVGGFVNKFADPLNLLGVSFGDNTNYLLQDIDAGSLIHPANNPQEFERFLTTLETIGLTAPVIIQSSDSGGVHVYYFLSKSVHTIELATLTKITLIDAAFDIKNGQLELFPDTKRFTPKGSKPSHYKPHRLPLQPRGGGMLLDREGNFLLAESDFSYEIQLQKFIELAIKSAATNDVDLLESKLAPAYTKFKQKIDKYQSLSGSKNLSERALEWKQNLETEFKIGWTGSGQTNDLLCSFVQDAIVFEKLTDRDEICKRVLDRVIVTRGYQEYCRHQRTIEERIADWVDCCLSNDYWVPYCALPPRRGGEQSATYQPPTSGSGAKANQSNITVADRAFKRFLDTIDKISEIPNRIGDLIQIIQRKSFELFGITISNTTLYKSKYKAIWSKLIATKNTSYLVPIIDDLGGGVCKNSETLSQQCLEVFSFCTEDNTLESLKPIFGETSLRQPHYGKCFTAPEGGGGNLLVDTDSNTSALQLSIEKNLLPGSLSQSILVSQPDNLSIPPSKLEESLTDREIEIDTNPQPPIINPPVESPSFKVKDSVCAIDTSDPNHQRGIIFRVVGSIATVVWKATMEDVEYQFSELTKLDRSKLDDRSSSPPDRLNLPLEEPIEPERLFLQTDYRLPPTDQYRVDRADISQATKDSGSFGGVA